MRTVRIIANARNLASMPPPPEGVEVWAANQRRGYNKWLPRICEQSEWTRWFNLHCRDYMGRAYPQDIEFYAQQTKPIYLQKVWADIPSSLEFPFKRIQEHFKSRYFSCSVAWLLAFAILEGFERIELWGIQIGKRKPAYSWERPCVFWWIKEAQSRNIEVWWPTEGTEDWDFAETGDPLQYTGPLYGYSTKPEPDWNPITEDWNS